MNFFIYVISGIWEFAIASIPLIIVFLLMKVCKIKEKKIFAILILQLLLSTYFWIKMKDIHIFLYQIFPYVSAFIWLLCNIYILKTIRAKECKQNAKRHR